MDTLELPKATGTWDTGTDGAPKRFAVVAGVAKGVVDGAGAVTDAATFVLKENVGTPASGVGAAAVAPSVGVSDVLVGPPKFVPVVVGTNGVPEVVVADDLIASPGVDVALAACK